MPGVRACSRSFVTVLMMSLCGACSTACAGAAELAGAAERGEEATISQFLRIRVPGAVRLAADGSVYARDFPDGIFQLYRRAPGAAITEQGRKITSFPDGLSTYDISPDGKFLTLEAAAGGNENNQVYLFDAATEQVTPLLQNPKVQHSVNVWLRDGSGFIYTANDASPRDFYIYRYDLATRKSTLLWSKPGQWSVTDVSDDGTRMIIQEYRSISDTSMYELNVTTGEATDLTARPADGGTSANAAVGYLQGEKRVLFASDFANGFVQLFVRDLAQPQATPTALLRGFDSRDLDEALLNHERTLLATLHNEDGYGALRVYSVDDTRATSALMMPDVPRGVASLNGFEKNTLVFAVSNANTPGYAYSYTAGNPRDKMIPPLVQMSARLDSEPVDIAGFLLPELVRFKSFDGVEIPAFLYLPAGAKKGTPIPFVVNYHGGPEGQFRPGFDRTVQYLVSQGYGVLQPNVRGSTGYGREFHMMDNYKKRWDSVKDGVEAARWLVREGYSENGRIAAYGGSYGGFMSVATIVEGPDVFGASINVVGIVNMKTFLEQTSGYRQKLREAEYGPLSDPEFLESVSPIKRVDQIKVPMMIAHGANDPRVPVGEAMQLAVALQKRGYDPELLFFPDEGHGFAKLENRILFNERMVKFLGEHIGKPALLP
ncbi:MAG: S9 family peptidase [Planctomycetota bacterium]|nr:S9 family peptidase [Planctomycetota bacterium]